MVRLKHRYILFDILYPPPSEPRTTEQRQKFREFNKSPKECTLTLHSPSPASVNQRSISTLLKRVVEDHFGEFGSGTVGLLIIVKYFSNKTSTGIIRCSRTNFQQVVAAIGLVTKVENANVVMRCVHVSGTIRKCEDFSIRRNRKLMVDIGRDDEMQNNLDDFISMFGDNDDDKDESP